MTGKMNDQELLVLKEMNVNRYEQEKNALYYQFIKMDEFIKDGLEKNATHRHFKTKKMMKDVMNNDFNPFNTYSYGIKDPTKPKQEKQQQL